MCLKTEACSLAAIRVASKKSKIALMSRWGVVSPLDTLLCSSHVLKFSTILRNGPLMPVTGVLLESRDQITSKCVILLLQQKLHLLFILSRFSTSQPANQTSQSTNQAEQWAI